MYVQPARMVATAALALVFSGCSVVGFDTGFREDPELESRILGAEHTAPDVDLLGLTPEIESYLAEHVPASGSDWDKVRRLQELLFDEEHLNIRYRDNATLTAAETFHAGYANCLALVNLYVAMARHIGLDVSYQTAEIRPRWNRRGELVVLSEHVNALGGLTGGRRYVMDFTPDVLLQPGSANVIPDARARAMYFNNLGVEALIEEDPAGALQYFRYALAVDSELAMAWNNIGSALNRLEQPRLAEYSYKKSFDLDRGSTTSINNLARYYSEQGDAEQAAIYRRVLDRINRDNPYYHFIRGNIAFEDQYYEEARRYFQQAIRRKENEPDFYYALGSTLEQLGRVDDAEEFKQLALQLQRRTDPRYNPTRDPVQLIDTARILRSSSPGRSIPIFTGLN